jgi:hypothetical protein
MVQLLVLSLSLSLLLVLLVVHSVRCALYTTRTLDPSFRYGSALLCSVVG